jgi:hypothetical protein
MKCDDFLPALETGGFLRRLQARGHAAGCRRCAAVHAAWTAAKRQLAIAEPLSPRTRQLWQRAVSERCVQPETRRTGTVAAWLAGATCVLAFLTGVAVRQDFFPPGSIPGGTDVNSPPEAEVVGEINSPTELSGLTAAVDRLDAELQGLQRLAERENAQQQIAATLRQFEGR